MTFGERLRKPKQALWLIGKWTFLSVLMGTLGGALGAGFHYVLHLVTEARLAHTWLIFLLPIGGLAIVGLYQLFRLKTNRGTDEILDAVQNDKSIPLQITPGIFSATAITHLLGGSAGREGAALQLGGSSAALLNKVFRLKNIEARMMILCGMSAVFSGLFCLPLTACLFALEFVTVGTLFSPALLPCFLSSITATWVSNALGVEAVTVSLDNPLGLTGGNILRLVGLAVLVSLLGMVMCYVFHQAKHLAEKWLKNPWFRITVGGVVIVALTLLVGDQRYNGAGMELALQAIHAEVNWFDFILKLLFTAITLGVGFKGGEIVPTLCIGATFGGAVGALLGLNPAFAAALGLVGLFCCVTNSPLASIVLSIEMFGATNLYGFVLMCVITFAFSGNCSLYADQKMKYGKLPFLKKES
ncbi:MAG: chloride channel protein [Clostridia bacterium]|nr:chloride channel protein [Clostridia bacterium]